MSEILKNSSKQGINLLSFPVFQIRGVCLFQHGNRQISQRFLGKVYGPKVPKNIPKAKM